MNLEHLFFLNDCIPKQVDKHTFLNKLINSVVEFNKLLEKNINVARGIVTHMPPYLCEYGDGFNLQQVLDLIDDKSTKDLAYSLFLKFPIGKPHYNDDYEELIAASYCLLLGEEKFDATNLAIVQKNCGFLLSPAVVDELMTDTVKISVDSSLDLELSNLFGKEINTLTIEEIILSLNQVNLELFEKFLSIFDKPVYCKQFRKDFDNLSIISKNLIISHFEDAIKRELVTNFSADGDLIKDVTPQKAKCHVFELRVRKEKELRIYFNESDGKMFFASIGFKNNNQQSQDIKFASKALNKLTLTNP